MGLFCLSYALLLALMYIMQHRARSQYQHEIDYAYNHGDRLVLDSVLKQQTEALEKKLMNILGFDELIQFVSDPEDKSARMVTEGIFLSLQSDQIVRMTIYNNRLDVILQMTNEGMPKRVAGLPAYLKPTFQKSAQNLSVESYFRGNEEIKEGFPVEYCGMTAITDDDDNVIGYVEIVKKVDAWVNELAALTKRAVAVLNIEKHQITFSTRPELYQKLENMMSSLDSNDSALINEIDDRFYHSDRLSLLSPDGKPVAQLLLTMDNTLQVSEQKRNLLLGSAFFLALFFGSLFGTILVIRHNVIKPVNKVIDGMNDSVSQTVLAIDKITSSGRMIANGASDQAASLQESSASVEEISAMTKQNATNANQADQLMKSAQSNIGQANGSMLNLTTSIDNISQASEETSNIIKTIDEISFQTNLLALNAAVEAARAGEAGAGFAVVADEVRSLALRAAEAAKSTSELLEATGSKIREGKDLVQSTNNAFHEIVSSAEQAGNLVSDIAIASGEQAEGIGQINNAISSIEQVTQQNATMAEDSAETSLEMEARVKEMRGYVDLLAVAVKGKKGRPPANDGRDRTRIQETGCTIGVKTGQPAI